MKHVLHPSFSRLTRRAGVVCATLGLSFAAASARAEVAEEDLLNPNDPTDVWGKKITGLGANGDETALVFTKTGETLNWTLPSNVNSIWYLVAGGGGSGGASRSSAYAGGGGGGAGGMRENMSFPIGETKSFSVSVGSGGARATPASWNASANGKRGTDSLLSFAGSEIVANGGGYGAYNGDGSSGGSGGGAGHNKSTGTSFSGGVGISGQGSDGGGQSSGQNGGGGGGGGAGGGGAAGVNATGGAGGSGAVSAITGSDAYYCAGGGGGAAKTGSRGAAGYGGGGSGGANSTGQYNGGDATTYGSGGGGACGNGSNSQVSGAGYQGVVIVRYRVMAANEVSVPTIAAKDYNGALQTADISDGPGYYVSANAGGTDAGDYVVTLTLSNSFVWVGGSTDPTNLTFTIAKAANSWVTEPSLSKTTWGQNEQPATVSAGAVSSGAEITVTYDDNETEMPLSQGGHTAYFSVAESKNYWAATVRTIPYTVTKNVNSWVTPAVVPASFNTEDPIPEFVPPTAAHGTVETFYDDDETKTTLPLSVGGHSVTYRVPANDEWLEIKQTIPFAVVYKPLYDEGDPSKVAGYRIPNLGDNEDEVALVFTNTSADITLKMDATYDNVRFLVVAGGGGGGGGTWGPGGGGGGVVTGIVQTLEKDVPITIKVGAGGVGGTSNGASGKTGGDSYVKVGDIKYVEAYGGGASKTAADGGNGGSGSGGGPANNNVLKAGGTATKGDYAASQGVSGECFGNNGGSNGSSVYAGGGGGGAVEPGGDGSGNTGGVGGNGLANAITGTSVIYGSGGGGGGSKYSYDNKSGAGMGAAAENVGATSGVDTRGGGGGGGGTNKDSEFLKGRRGGSGIVVLRYTKIAGLAILPKIGSKTYTGGTLTADVADGEGYVVTENDGGADVGDYDVVLTPRAGYRWESGSSDPTNLTFSITQATNAWTVLPSVSKPSWLTSEEPGMLTPAELAFSNATAFISRNGKPATEFDGKLPEAAGAYTITYAAPETTANVAAPEETTKTVAFDIISENAVAKVGDYDTYDTLAEAFAAAQPNDVIQLLASTTTPKLDVTNCVTLALKGYTVSVETEGQHALFVVKNAATLTIDGMDAGSTLNGAVYVGAAGNDDCSLVINGGTYTASKIVSGVLTHDFDDCVIQSNGLCTNITITATGATFNSTDDTFYLAAGGTYTLTGCTVNGYTGIYLKGGTLNMTGTTVAATGPYADPVANGNGAASTGDGIIVDAKLGYTGNVSLNLGSGNTIASANGYAIRETYTDANATAVHAIDISGGSYGGAKGAFVASEYFDAALTNVPATATCTIANVYLSGAVDTKYLKSGFLIRQISDGRWIVAPEKDTGVVTYTWTGGAGTDLWGDLGNWDSGAVEFCAGYPNSDTVTASFTNAVAVNLDSRYWSLKKNGLKFGTDIGTVVLSNGTVAAEYESDRDFGADDTTVVFRDAHLVRQRLGPVAGATVIFEGASSISGMTRPWNAQNVTIIFRNGEIEVGSMLHGTYSSGCLYRIENARVTMKTNVNSTWNTGNIPTEFVDGPDRQACLVHTGKWNVEGSYRLTIPADGTRTPYLQAVEHLNTSGDPSFRINVENWKGGRRIPIVKFTSKTVQTEFANQEFSLTAQARDKKSGQLVDVTAERNARLEWSAADNTLYYVQDGQMGFVIYVK